MAFADLIHDKFRND